MSSYNLEKFKAPRLSGVPLDVFSRLLRIPFIGTQVLELIKKKNKTKEMVLFANTSRYHEECDESERTLELQQEQLMPLYYPIHEMTKEEQVMHQRMIKDAPLDLIALADASVAEHGLKGFRHWTISDYTSRYQKGLITPTQVVNKIISLIEEMNKQNQNSAIVTQMDKEELRLLAAESTKRYQSKNIMGVLDGVPILVKDEIPTVGHTVTLGTSFLSNSVENDILPIVKLKRQGVIIIGKTNQHEIGIGTTGFNLLHGTPFNPYGNRITKRILMLAFGLG